MTERFTFRGFGPLVPRSFMARASGSAPAPTPTPTPSFGVGQVQGIDFGARNGDPLSGLASTQRYLSSITLTNLFGDRNNANTAGGALPGALILKVRVQPGMLFQTPISSAYNQQQVIFGTTSTAGRNIRLLYFPAQAVAGQAGFRGRFVVQGAFANGSRFGDRAPTTGNPGDTSSTSGLRSAEVDARLAVDDVITLAFRLVPDGSGGFLTRLDHVLPDGTLVAGDSFAQTATAGIATLSSTIDIGRFSGASAVVSSNFMGAVGDFTQIDNHNVTDAEIIRMARGEAPTSIWAADKLALWFRFGGPADLAQTGGFKTVASPTLVGSALAAPGPAMGGAVDAATGRGIWLRPHSPGFVHALDPALVRPCTSAAQVAALTGAMTFCVRLFGGGSTHVWARVRRGGAIIATQRLTTTPVGDGEYVFTCPGVPTGTGYIREVVREDALTAVCRDSEEHRVGPVALITGQSQTNIGFCTVAAPGAPALPATNKVSVIDCKGFNGASIENTPAYGARLDRATVLGAGANVIAAAWDAATTGLDIPLGIALTNRNGSGRINWINRATEGSSSATYPWTGDIFGNAVDWTTGLVTRVALKLYGRWTFHHEGWSTSDASPISSDPAYFPALMNKFYGGIGRTGSEASFAQFNPVFRPWIVSIPADRHRNNTVTAEPLRGSGPTLFQTVRTRMRAYLLGAGVDPSIDAEIGGYNLPYAIGGATVSLTVGESTHQDRAATEQGLVRYMEFYANSLMRGARVLPYDPETGFSTATRSGNVITLATARPNGGTIDTYLTGNTPVGFEVSEDGGATWSRSTGSIPFTVAISGTNVTLTRSSGSWAAGTLVQYLFGYPWHVGSGTSTTDMAAEQAGGGQFLVEVANGRRYPLRPSFAALEAA